MDGESINLQQEIFPTLYMEKNNNDWQNLETHESSKLWHGQKK